MRCRRASTLERRERSRELDARADSSYAFLDDVRNYLTGAHELPVTTLDHHYSALTSNISDCTVTIHACQSLRYAFRTLEAQVVLLGVHSHEIQKSPPLLRALEHQDGCEGLRPPLMELQLQVTRR